MMDITILNDFYKFSNENKISAIEQAFYVRLVLIANAEFWPEVIERSYPELIEDLNISRRTFFKTRKRLEELGLISVVPSPGGSRTKSKYKLNEIEHTTSAKENRCKIEPVQNSTKNWCKIAPRTSAKGNRFTPDKPSNDAGFQTRQTYKHINNTTTTTERAREGENTEQICEQIKPENEQQKERKSPDNFSMVREIYEDNIHPIFSGYELEALTDDVEQYGADTVIKAMQRAVKRGVRNLGYVEGILKRWEANGYDDEQQGAGATNGDVGAAKTATGGNVYKTGRYTPAAPDNINWDELPKGWPAANAENNTG